MSSGSTELPAWERTLSAFEIGVNLGGWRFMHLGTVESGGPERQDGLCLSLDFKRVLCENMANFWGHWRHVSVMARTG